MEQHKDPDHYMDVLEHIGRTEPSEDFLQRMEGLAIAYVSGSRKPSRLFILTIAASLLVLVLANVYVVSSAGAQRQSTETQQSYYDNLIPIKSLYHE